MEQNELTEVSAALAEGILKMNFSPGDLGLNKSGFDKILNRFVYQELPKEKIGKLTTERLVLLFEDYCRRSLVRKPFSP